MYIVQCEMFLTLYLSHTETQFFKQKYPVIYTKISFKDNLWACIIFTTKDIATWGTFLLLLDSNCFSKHCLMDTFRILLF